MAIGDRIWLLDLHDYHGVTDAFTEFETLSVAASKVLAATGSTHQKA